MPVEIDDLIRAARPVAPVSLEKSVLDKLARRRWPIAVGAVVAIAAIVTVVILMRGEDRGELAALDAALAIAPPDTALPATAPDAPPPPEPTWSNLATIRDQIEASRGPIAGCGGTGAITIHVERQRDGRARASHPLLGIGGRGPSPLERCRVTAVAAIQLPAMPAGLISIDFRFPIAPQPQPAGAWTDPLAMIRTAIGKLDLRACKTKKLTVVVDRTTHENPRIWLPRWQFEGKPPPCSVSKADLPALPELFGEVQIHVDVP